MVKISRIQDLGDFKWPSRLHKALEPMEPHDTHGDQTDQTARPQMDRVAEGHDQGFP